MGMPVTIAPSVKKGKWLIQQLLEEQKRVMPYGMLCQVNAVAGDPIATTKKSLYSLQRDYNPSVKEEI